MSAETPNEEKLVGSDRVLAVLLELAEHPSGVSLDELATLLGSTKPTVHRALASLRKAGLASKSARGVYELGDEFLRLAYRFQDARPETARIEPVLRQLAAELGETAHFAVLDGQDVVYRAKVDPPIGAIRLSSTIGGRNPAYSTAVGKLLLGFDIHSLAELESWLGDSGLPTRTEKTITNPAALLTEITASRERGYGLDDQENEVGINCIALPVYLEPGRPVSGAVSMSGLVYRRSLDSLVSSVDIIRDVIESHLGPGSTGRHQ